MHAIPTQNQEFAAVKITPQTRLILSTSGRVSSLKRYQKLLQEVLQLDVAYLPILPYPGESAIGAENFAMAIRGLGAIGGAISKDIKFKILPFLDEVEEFAQRVNSVNTVIRSGQRLIGYNTDAHGFEQAIRKGIEDYKLSIRSAVVYGYGGVFSVVYHVLTQMGIEVAVSGRRQEAITAINKEFGLRPFDGTPRDLFVNAAPVTDQPLAAATNFLSALKGCSLVFDHQMPGKYLADYCKEAKINYIPGSEMYYPQMYKQWELFLRGVVDKEKIPDVIAKAEALATQ